jgi:hypothetical protein
VLEHRKTSENVKSRRMKPTPSAFVNVVVGAAVAETFSRSQGYAN